MLKGTTTVLFLLFSWIAFSQTGDLTVIVTGFESEEGDVQVGLYNNAEDFPEEGKEYKIKRAPVNGGKIKLTFKNLKAGEYAFGVFHDKNEDGECNLNLLGVPVEGYGFSRNYEPTISEPDFDDCKFEIKRNKKMKVKLIN